MAPKKKKPPTKTRAPVAKSREQTFYDSLDLPAMWLKFTQSANRNGTPKYKTVWQFIVRFSEEKWKREMLYWILGPKVEGNAASPYRAFDQLDWEQKRTDGYWFAPRNLENLNREISQSKSAFGKLATLGSTNVAFIARLENIIRQIDLEFSGGIQLPNLSAKENALRASMYMQLNQTVLNMLAQAQGMYAKTQGLDLAQLAQILSIASNVGSSGLGASLGLVNEEQRTLEGTKGNAVAAQFADMIMRKTVDYDMDIPPGTEILAAKSGPTRVK